MAPGKHHVDVSQSLENLLLRVWFGSSGRYNPSFHIFPALLKNNHFQSPRTRGTLRNGPELHRGSPFGTAIWDLTVFKDVANGDCTL